MGREALPEVLTAWTERPVGHWRAEVRSPAWRGLTTFDATSRRPPRVRWKVEVDFARKTTRERSTLLTVESPEAAVEVLSERGLWPWAPGDVNAPRWFCEACGSPVKVVEGVSREDREVFAAGLREGLARGALALPENARVQVVSGVDYARCPTCDNARSTNTPRSLADLVAVASLGAATLRRVAELVRELCAVTRGETGATLVWRVMSAEALREHREWCLRTSALGMPAGQALTLIFGDEEWRRREGRTSLTSAVWPEACPYADLPDDRAERRGWPILRALAVHEDGKTPTGLHLVAADRERVVIAVEAP